MYCGAQQMLPVFSILSRVVSGGGSAPARPGRSPTKVPARAVPRKALRLQRSNRCSSMAAFPHSHYLRFQLFAQLVPETQVCSVRDDLLRSRSDHPGLMQAQRPETHRIQGVALPPFAVGDILERLERIVVA